MKKIVFIVVVVILLIIGLKLLRGLFYLAIILLVAGFLYNQFKDKLPQNKPGSGTIKID